MKQKILAICLVLFTSSTCYASSSSGGGGGGGGSPTGSASGDLGSSYPSPTVNYGGGYGVNYDALQFIGSATGVSPQIQTVGGDTNISLNLVPKGTGSLLLNGLNAIYFPVYDSTLGNSIAIGNGAVATATTGSIAYQNTVIGAGAMGTGTLTSAAIGNTMLGYQAGKTVTTGYSNTYIGALAGSSNATANLAVCIGNSSCVNGSGSYTVAVGNSTRGSSQGVAVGFQALGQNFGGSGNIGIGYNAGNKISNGSNNVTLGQNVGSSTIATGSNNILIGTTAAVDTPTAATNYYLDIGASIVGTMVGGTTPSLAVLTPWTAPSYLTTVTTVTSSATPALAATNGLQTITLSANATPTITGIASGQRVTFQICQPATGGPYTWTWPASVHGGMTIGTTASTCSVQSFDSFNGTTLVAESLGIANVAP